MLFVYQPVGSTDGYRLRSTADDGVAVWLIHQESKGYCHSWLAQYVL